MPNTRERLVELLYEAHRKSDEDALFRDITYAQQLGVEADILIANGVTVLNCSRDCKNCWKTKIVTPVQQWIPVTERLPEDDGSYLVAKKGYKTIHMDVYEFAKDGRKIDENDFHQEWENVWYTYDCEYGYFTVNSVTHWMPLPQPPAENTK